MKNKIIALDSNIFIYHFEQNLTYIPYTRYLFNELTSGSFIGITSIISLIETLSYPSPKDVLETITEGFRTLPNFTMYDINSEIAVETARIRRKYRVRLPDAVQLATALAGKADIFVTNDTKLQRFKEIKVLSLQKFAHINNE